MTIAGSTPMHRIGLQKPDGRWLWLYDRAPLDPDADAPVPDPSPFAPRPHLRWHPLRGEWVIYSDTRQHRTFLPPASHDPLAPARSPDAPTEVPSGTWSVAVFENRFPALFAGADEAPAAIVDTRPARGSCEVVVYTQAGTGALASLPLWHIELLIGVWADRTRELGARADVEYVFPFENRGVEVGVTLHHPHGQIYAYPFVPPLPARELEMQRLHLARTGRNLLVQLGEQELEDGRRIVYAGPDVVAYVPVCARYAYEMWIAPTRPCARFPDLDAEQVVDFARALKTVLMKLDKMWDLPMPYVLAFHQAPTDGASHPEAQLHVEIYPAYRMPGRLKYLAGSEIGAGAFTADTQPERTAAELAAVEVEL